MIRNYNKPILITGSHRSGTTWTGRMIALSNKVKYIHEPFNISFKDRYPDMPFEFWFEHISNSNDKEAYKYINSFISFRRALNSFLAIRGFSTFNRFNREFKENVLKRPLFKDPIAFFACEWLADRFNMDVIVLIRHPAAFIKSLLDKNMNHNFAHFVKQPLLMDRLHVFKEQIIEFSNEKKNTIDQGILLWNIFHSEIKRLQEKYEHWTFIRHEDLSSKPIKNFKTLYNKLDFRFTSDIEKKILEYTDGREESEFKRNSMANISKWKSSFNSSEIDRIYENTKKIAQHFYSEDEW